MYNFLVAIVMFKVTKKGSLAHEHSVGMLINVLSL